MDDKEKFNVVAGIVFRCQKNNFEDDLKFQIGINHQAIGYLFPSGPTCLLWIVHLYMFLSLCFYSHGYFTVSSPISETISYNILFQSEKVSYQTNLEKVSYHTKLRIE